MHVFSKRPLMKLLQVLVDQIKIKEYPLQNQKLKKKKNPEENDKYWCMGPVLHYYSNLNTNATQSELTLEVQVLDLKEYILSFLK